jgi:hypothetical protein
MEIKFTNIKNKSITIYFLLWSLDFTLDYFSTLYVGKKTYNLGVR